MKDSWIIPDADLVTVVSKKEVYPVIVICDGHDYIDAVEIPNSNYVRVKYRGKWVELYLPIDAT
ncbi:MAG: hypothetical protein EHM34_09310 [Nitrosopumilales archaeon]|nr:MAG: hypothetical protein EHM34_09310 [Nitrosopumilales archaeon]